MNELVTNIHIPFDTYILWIVLGVVIILSIIMAAVFKHHWSYYGISIQNKFFVTTIYILGSILIGITLMVLALLY